MDANRDLLCVTLALQAGLIDSVQFSETVGLRRVQEDCSLIDLLVERGWLKSGDIAHLSYLVERRLEGDRGHPHPNRPAGHHDEQALPAGVDVSRPQPAASVGDRPDSLPHNLTVDFVPQTTDRYELVGLHARGGIGHVWLARDHSLDRDVALKELRPELRGDPQATRRFLREARITGQLEHPGVTPVYDCAERDTKRGPFYSMRFVKGPTLSEAASTYHQRRLKGEADLSELQDLLNAFVAVCNTAAYAHSRHVLHRDLKCQNVVLGEFGEVVVLDWGLAKFMRAERDDSDVHLLDDGSGDGLLTTHGQTLGTPAYMAPEQAAGRLNEIDHRTDIYGLGAMLYEILAGQPPFFDTSTAQLLRKVQQDPPTPPRELVPDVPLPLEAACLRALAKDPKDRYSTAVDLARAVEKWQETERKAAEEALKNSEALYHSLVETIPMNIWRKDTEGRFTFANEGFCNASGRTLEQLLGETDFDVFPRDLAEKYRQDDEFIMSTGEIFDATELHVTGKGETLHVRVIKLPIHDARGHVVGTQGIFWDVSEVKRLEEELQKKQTALENAMNQNAK